MSKNIPHKNNGVLLIFSNDGRGWRCIFFKNLFVSLTTKFTKYWKGSMKLFCHRLNCLITCFTVCLFGWNKIYLHFFCFFLLWNDEWLCCSHYTKHQSGIHKCDLILCACISISHSLWYFFISLSHSLLFFLAGHTLLSSMTDCIAILYKCCNGPLLQALKVYCTDIVQWSILVFIEI